MTHPLLFVVFRALRNGGWVWAGAALLLLMLAAREAGAHGDYNWIMENRETAWCCGPQDCDELPAGAVKWTPEGWHILSTGQVFAEGQPGLFDSPDGQWHGCVYLWGQKTGQYRCLFRPESGT